MFTELEVSLTLEVVNHFLQDCQRPCDDLFHFERWKVGLIFLIVFLDDVIDTEGRFAVSNIKPNP